MKYYYFVLWFLLVLIGCRSDKKQASFTIAFGSCNNQLLKNNLWDVIETKQADVWIWGGDVIYSDTHDMEFLRSNYKMLSEHPSYAKFKNNIEIIGVWDDHDYGMNDGGVTYEMKADSQKAFLDFLEVDKKDPRRKREGIYTSSTYTSGDLSIKILLLDTRYFRTDLTKDSLTSKRYRPNDYGQGTLLGEQQWAWLENELVDSEADFNILVSSIQFLSEEHGYETWGNMPHEVDKLENLLVSSKAKNAIILSGDRHISEISKKTVADLNYPLIDFTSSGLTHSYEEISHEPNRWRVGDIVSKRSFGVLEFNGDNQEVTLEIWGENDTLLKRFIQKYE